MNTHKETKINQLLQQVPSGTVITTKWLHSIGISLSLLTAYVKSGWLDRIGDGAVIRRGQKVEWPGAVNTLQNQLGLSLHPAGKTALGLLGSLHFVPLGRPPVHLFCRNQENVPKWFTKYEWLDPVHIFRSGLFGDTENMGMTVVKEGEFSLRVSSHERAIMEYLYLLKKDDIGDEPVKLMEGLAWLRPEVVQTLLESCRSVKVKRLFLVLAEQLSHPWLKKLDISRIDIGKGKRQFVVGGVLHPRYLITVPKSWHPSGWMHVNYLKANSWA
jgi:hypothetical protein